MFKKKQAILSVTIAITVMVFIVGISATLPVYSEVNDVPVADASDKKKSCDALAEAVKKGNGKHRGMIKSAANC